MHELGLTRSIVEICADRCEGRPVLQVLLELGEASAVAPEALRFCFDVVSRGGLVEGARLEIVRVPGDDLRIRELEVA